MADYYSRVIYPNVNTGTVPNYAVPFPYLLKESVLVLGQEAGANEVELVDGADYTWSGDATIHFLVAKVYETLTLQRVTPQDSLISDPKANSSISSAKLARGYLQFLYLNQEASETVLNPGQARAYRPGLSAAAYRTLISKDADRFDFRDMAGADLTGSNDMASTLQLALDTAYSSRTPLHIPRSFEGQAIAVDSPITVQTGVEVRGEGFDPYFQGRTGSHIQFTHEGVGITFQSTGLPSGNVFRDMMVSRDQPKDFGVGWTPNEACDFDIVNNNADLRLENFCFLNATKGLRQTSSTAGRTTLVNVTGQPMRVGVQIDDVAEGFRARDTRWWSYWAADESVYSYLRANRDGLVLKHVDNPAIFGWFDIFSKRALVLSPHVNGPVNNGNIFGFEADVYGQHAIHIEDGHDGANLTVHGSYAFGHGTSEEAVLIEGDSNLLRMVGMKCHGVQRQVGKLLGTNNKLVYGSGGAVNFNQANGGFQAFNASAGNRIVVDPDTVNLGGNNGQGLANDAALVSSDQRFAINLSVSAGTGGINAGTVLVIYRRNHSRIRYDAYITITNNGTGSGYVQVAGLPVAALGGETFAGSGRDEGSGGKGLVTTVSGTTLFIRSADGSYPGYNGASFVVSGEYEAVA